MKEFCIVVSQIMRKEICISAESEDLAIEKAKRLYESGKVELGSEKKENVNFHAKY